MELDWMTQKAQCRVIFRVSGLEDVNAILFAAKGNFTTIRLSTVSGPARGTRMVIVYGPPLTVGFPPGC